jgi:hypothetical protein
MMPRRQPRAQDDRHGHFQRRVPLPATAGGITGGQPGPGWTLVLRRQPIGIADGQPQGGYADVYELICCYCGDDPGLDYRRVSPELQRIRGPYPIAAGSAAYGRHAGHHRRPAAQPGGSAAARKSW